MAEVFRGKLIGALGFERTVAIKRILPALADQERYTRMFVREAHVVSQLSHPNIVSAFDFDRDSSGHLFLVMEFVDGVDLRQLLGTGPLPHALAVFLISEILCGLRCAHNLRPPSGAQGVVHCDLSPQNILLSWEGAVKVADFGLAKTRAASAEVSGSSSRAIGTCAFISPEQLDGRPVDGRSDLFSVGVMLWEMLTCERLFWTGDIESTVFGVHFKHIPRPGFIRSVARDLEAVVMRLLDRDPARRYPTADAALAALLRCEDAPSNGCSDLVRLLADRFPQHAPSRRARPAAPFPRPPRAWLHRRRPMTRTLHPPLPAQLHLAAIRRRRLARWALLAIVAAAAVVLGLVIGLGVERALRIGREEACSCLPGR